MSWKVTKTTGTYEAATPPLGRKAIGAKWVFTYKTDKDDLIVEEKLDVWLGVEARRRV